MTTSDSLRKPAARGGKLRADGLERLRATAAARGGQLLDDRYLGVNVHYRFRCAQGHEWQASGHSVLGGSWCKRCSDGERSLARRDPEGLVRLQAVAAAKGGVCLSQSYTSRNGRYRFRCVQGHEWDATGRTVIGGTWCRQCSDQERSLAGRDPEGLARLQAAAAAKGGVCLSQTYTNQHARYRFRCAQGHEWETQGQGVLRDGWCPSCAFDAKRLSLAVFQEIAAQRGGQCLSQTYQDSKTKLTWMCGKGHVWQAAVHSVKRGAWCPECAHADRIEQEGSPDRLDEIRTMAPDPASPLDRLKNAATIAHVQLLDERWRGWSAQYRLRCTAGHVWSRIAKQIVYEGPVACPECRRIEQLARLITVVEQNGSICLDTHWHGFQAKYRFRCATGHLWQRSAAVVLSLNCVACPQCTRQAAREKKLLPNGLEQLRTAATARGGQLLDDRYLGLAVHYRLRCNQGHEWEAVGSTVLRGNWCPQCSREENGRARRDSDGLARLQAAAAAKGGVCLSQTYTEQSARYRFRCAQGHEWESPGDRVLHGSWCRPCAHEAQRLGIAVFKAIAAERGGQCLSDTYRNNRSKLTWMCHKGHVWQAFCSRIKQGSWCPECAHANRITRANSPTRIRYRNAPL